MAKKGKCENIGICSLANREQIQVITDDSLPFQCMECKDDLKEVPDDNPPPPPLQWKKILIIAGFVAVLGGAGFGVYKIFTGEKPKIIVTIDPANPTVTVNDTIRLTAKTDQEDAKLTWTWASEDKSIATVSRSGVVTGVKEGNVTITVKDEKKKVLESVTVTVVLPDVPIIQSIKLIPESLSLQVKASDKLAMEITPENADQSSLRWESDKPSVATVNAGNINAVAEGVAMITLTDTKGGVKAEAKITVTKVPTDPPPPCGTYKGETSANGQPHGLGTFTYSSRSLIDDLKMVYAEQGDYITGTFREGKIVSVHLYDSGGNLKQTVIPQQPASICR